MATGVPALLQWCTPVGSLSRITDQSRIRDYAPYAWGHVMSAWLRRRDWPASCCDGLACTLAYSPVLIPLGGLAGIGWQSA